MGFSAALSQTGFAVSTIMLAMVLVALIELAIPLRARGLHHRRHVVPNLALTLVTLATNALYNIALVLLLVWVNAQRFGLLRWLDVGSWASAMVGFVLLDFSFYVVHVGMHKLPVLWRVHRVHHSDPVMDVTTTLRQHPLEGIFRYVCMAAFACVLGVGVETFAVYRGVSALNGLLEHANIRVPDGWERALSWVTTWFGTHRVHHSRDQRETDTNYGNIFSWFDRLFGTFTPATRGKAVDCGLDGTDAPFMQTTAGLLVMPFSGPAAPAALSSQPLVSSVKEQPSL